MCRDWSIRSSGMPLANGPETDLMPDTDSMSTTGVKAQSSGLTSVPSVGRVLPEGGSAGNRRPHRLSSASTPENPFPFPHSDSHSAATSAVMPLESWPTVAEICERWKIGKRQLGNLRRGGLPVVGRGRGARVHPLADVWRDEFLRLSAAARRSWYSRDGRRFLRRPPAWPRLSLRLALARAELRAAWRAEVDF